MKAESDLHGGWHTRAIEGLYEGRGNGLAPWNPTKIVECLRQLERWTRRALLRRKTRLQCFEGCGVQTVTDAYPNRTSRLQCGHTRQTHTMSDSEYADLVERANGLKIQRNAVLGGFE
jgi:hypothetical protein